MEAEFYQAYEATKEALMWRNLQDNLFHRSLPAIIIYEDNQSALKAIHNATFTDRTKHFSVKCRATVDYYQKLMVDFCYIETTNQIADIMTKALAKNLQAKFTEGMGLLPI